MLYILIFLLFDFNVDIFRIIQLKEWGLNRRYIKHFILGTSVQCGKLTPVNKKFILGIHDVFTAFMIILVGHVSSLVILMIEIVIVYYSKYKNQA